MTDEHKLAWKKREEMPYAKVREVFVKKFDQLMRAMQLEGADFFKVFWTQLVDNGAVYGVQIGVTREEFLAWAAESYDLYAAFTAECEGDPEKAKSLRWRLYSETRGQVHSAHEANHPG